MPIPEKQLSTGGEGTDQLLEPADVIQGKQAEAVERRAATEVAIGQCRGLERLRRVCGEAQGAAAAASGNEDTWGCGTVAAGGWSLAQCLGGGAFGSGPVRIAQEYTAAGDEGCDGLRRIGERVGRIDRDWESIAGGEGMCRGEVTSVRAGIR